MDSREKKKKNRYCDELSFRKRGKLLDIIIGTACIMSLTYIMTPNYSRCLTFLTFIRSFVPIALFRVFTRNTFVKEKEKKKKLMIDRCLCKESWHNNSVKSANHLLFRKAILILCQNDTKLFFFFSMHLIVENKIEINYVQIINFDIISQIFKKKRNNFSRFQIFKKMSKCLFA